MSSSSSSSSSSPPIAAPTRSRSHSLSNPIPSTSLSPPSLAFSALSLSPGTLPPDSLTRAYQHARSASFNGATQSRPTSLTDGSSNASSDLPTPGSSPVPLALGGMKPGRPSSTKASETLFEQDEYSALSTSPSTLFANGARWGWPQSSSGGALPPSPPSSSSSFGGSHSRRASIGVGQSASYGMMAPLGRVSSAGAALGSAPSGGKGTEGFGLFRRMSIGFGTKNKPPSPPSFGRTPETPPPTPLAKAPSLPVPVLGGEKSSTLEVPGDRSRRASMGGPKPKRNISPNGERILRGGFEY